MPEDNINKQEDNKKKESVFLSQFTEIVKKRIGDFLYLKDNSARDKDKTLTKQNTDVLFEELNKEQRRQSLYGDEMEEQILKDIKNEPTSDNILIGLFLMKNINKDVAGSIKIRKGEELREYQKNRVNTVLEAMASLKNKPDHRHVKQLIELINLSDGLNEADKIEYEKKIYNLNLRNSKQDIETALENIKKERPNDNYEENKKYINNNDKKYSKEGQEIAIKFRKILDSELNTQKRALSIYRLMFSNDRQGHGKFSTEEMQIIKDISEELGKSNILQELKEHKNICVNKLKKENNSNINIQNSHANNHFLTQHK